MPAGVGEDDSEDETEEEDTTENALLAFSRFITNDRWVTTKDDQKVYIGDDGGFRPHGPGSDPVTTKKSSSEGQKQLTSTEKGTTIGSSGGDKTQTKEPKMETTKRPVSAIIKDFMSYQASARNMRPEQAKERGLKIRDEMAAALPTLKSEQATKARQDALRGIGQWIHQAERDIAGWKESLRTSPHMQERIDEAEKEVAEMRKGLDAAAHIVDEGFWEKQTGKNTDSYMAKAMAAHPQAKAGR